MGGSGKERVEKNGRKQKGESGKEVWEEVERGERRRMGGNRRWRVKTDGKKWTWGGPEEEGDTP